MAITNTQSETHKMLALNTINLSHKTWDAIRDGAEWSGLVIYPKDNFGFFIAIDESSLDLDTLPNDLCAAVNLAYDLDADWLMFDPDVDYIDEGQMELDLSYDD